MMPEVIVKQTLPVARQQQTREQSTRASGRSMRDSAANTQWPAHRCNVWANVAVPREIWNGPPSEKGGKQDKHAKARRR